MTSVIHKSPDPYTDPNITKLYRDPLLNKGSRFLFDFLDGYGNPNADGALAPGATFKNLVDGGGDAVLLAGSGGTSGTIAVANAANKAGITSTGQTGNLTSPPLILLGNPQSIGANPALLILWIKTLANSFQGGAAMDDVVSASGAAGTVQWAYSFYLAAGAQTFQPGTRVQGSTLVGPLLPAAPGAVRQIAMSISGGTVQAFVNGVAAGSATGAANPVGDTGNPPRLNLGQAGTFYRAYMERLDLSGRTALAAVQADYAANSARFA